MADRHELECWQALHPTWLARFGPPPDGVQGNVHRVVRSPGRLEYRGRAVDPPANAVSVGNRIYLRPIEQEDAETIARWSMRETETGFDTGRPYRSPISYWEWHRTQATEHFPSWVRFAICLLKDGEVIGSNGLADIDWLNRTAETETEIVRSEYRGGGYGTEAKHLCSNTDSRTLESTWSGAWPGRSIREAARRSASRGTAMPGEWPGPGSRAARWPTTSCSTSSPASGAGPGCRAVEG